jgi:Restriction endonuclease
VSNLTPKKSKRQISEVDDFHPLVAGWLQKQGYPYEHHVKLADGIVDFVASIDGKKTLIECKTGPVRNREVAQLVGYMWDVPGSIGMIALPADSIDERAITLCKRWDIEMLPIEIGDAPELVREKIIRDFNKELKSLRGANAYFSIYRHFKPELDLGYKDLVQYYLDRFPKMIDPIIARFLKISCGLEVVRELHSVLLSAGFDKATGLSSTDITCLLHIYIMAEHAKTAGLELKVPHFEYSDGEDYAELVGRIGLEEFFGKIEGKWIREELEKRDRGHA